MRIQAWANPAIHAQSVAPRQPAHLEPNIVCNFSALSLSVCTPERQLFQFPLTKMNAPSGACGCRKSKIEGKKEGHKDRGNEPQTCQAEQRSRFCSLARLERQAMICDVLFRLALLGCGARAVFFACLPFFILRRAGNHPAGSCPFEIARVDTTDAPPLTRQNLEIGVQILGSVVFDLMEKRHFVPSCQDLQVDRSNLTRHTCRRTLCRTFFSACDRHDVC